MMTLSESKQIMFSEGRRQALDLQERSAEMDGTQLYAEANIIPDFRAACATENMLNRARGFVCKSTAGRVVRLLQPYDSEIYTEEPESYPALWGFVWSKDPAKALPFVAISTSPYGKGDCCLDKKDKVKRSRIDGNVWSPEDYPQGWEEATM